MFTRALQRFQNQRWRRLAPVGVALSLIAAPMVVMPSSAFADSGSGLSGSPFNGKDGVLDTTPAVAGHDDVGTPDTFAGGVKEDTDCPGTLGGGAPDKADITTAWVGDANGKVSGVDHNFLYLAWARPSNEGTATIDFELNSGTTKCSASSPFVRRVAGQDLLVTYDFQGGSTIGVSVRKWTTSHGGEWSAPTVLPVGQAEAQISANGLFGELVVDMTAAGFFQAGVCKDFSSAMAKSRASSSSFENQVKDLILPFPIEVTNCGSLKVTKTVAGPALPGASFSFTADCGSYDLNGAADGKALTFSLHDGENRLIEDIPLGTVCSVSESSPGAGWSTSYTVASGSAQAGLSATNLAIALGTKVVAFTNTRLTGDLTISKTAQGGNGTFVFDVDCSDNRYDRLGDNPVSITTTGGSGSATLTGIPTGTSCRVTERGNPLFTQTVVSPEDGVIVAGSENDTVSVTNVRNTGTLRVAKVADVAGTFVFDIDCNDGNAHDATGVEIAAGAHYDITGIPTGTSCTVTERGNDLFTQTAISPAGGVILIGSGINTVTVTNARNRGTLRVIKQADAAGTFLFDIVCTDGTHESNVQIQAGSYHEITGIPTGTSCTVTEQGNQDFTQTSVVPAGGVITIVTGLNTVTFTNTRNTGTLRVAKVADVAGTFKFDIDCNDGTAHDASDVEIAAGAHQDFTGIPTGTSCTVTEQNNPDFHQTSVVPEGGVITIGTGTNTVTFTNARNRGSLLVTKAADEDGDFRFDIVCTDGTSRSNIAIARGGSYRIDGIPTGTGCTVTERANGLFTSVSVPSDGTKVIVEGTATVAFTNTAKPNGISIDKTVNGEDTSAEAPLDVEVGSPLHYRVVVTNSGQVPLAISSLSDSLKADLAGSCSPSLETMLDPGESVTCTYTMAAADPGGDSIIHNTASASGSDVLERSAGPVSDETFVHVLNPAIHLDKSGPALAHVGDTITYTLTVTNPGNTPLSIIDFADDVCNGAPTLKSKQGEDNLLDPGETWGYECSHVVVDGDPVSLVNTATVTGADKLETEVDSTDDATTAILKPAILITKTGASTVHVGDAVVYTLLVTNPGNTALADVKVTDPKCDGAPVRSTVDADGLLSPGESWTYNCTHVATAGDGASILNTAKAEGTDPLGETVNNSANHTAVVLHPAITIDKTADPVSISGSGSVTYTYLVTNTGDTTLFNVLVTDDILGPIGQLATLPPGASATLFKTVDVDTSTPPTNIGTAVGTDVLGEQVTANDSATITVVLAEVATRPEPAQELPRTGAPLGAETKAAVTLIEVGLLLELSARRRRRTRRQAD